MKPTLVFQGRTEDPDLFFQRYQRSAAALAALGVGDGDVVALMLRNGVDVMDLMLATRWLGAYWCPVNWHFKTDEVRHILKDSGAKVFVAEDDLIAALGDVTPEGVASFGMSDWAARRDATAPLATPALPPRGAMLYTSGTTGRPKGIRRAPAGPDGAARRAEIVKHCYGLDENMRSLLVAPVYHSAPNGFALAMANEGTTLFIEQKFDAERTLQLIAEHGITHAYLVPTMYVRMLRLPDEVKRKYDLSSMRFVSSTGSPCPPDVKRAMIEWWGPVIHECYGSSELGYMTRLDSAQALAKPGSAGKALPGVELKILDKEGHELPRNQAGLIYVRQLAAADFTYNDNDAARRAMERDGFLTMADVGYLDDDDFLFIVDRQADMVISGGVNIYPAEIEAALQMMPGVEDCAVFGIPDAEFGEGIAAAVQPRKGVTLTADDVQSFLKARIAGYKVPRVVAFHADMPREDTGKIFKRKLREPYWEGQARRI